MSEKVMDFSYCDELVKDFEKVIEHPIAEKSKTYYTGVDLGTACVVLAVLDDKRRPVAGAYRYADVIKDGMVVDYIGAVRIVKELKEEIEKELGTEPDVDDEIKNLTADYVDKLKKELHVKTYEKRI